MSGEPMRVRTVLLLSLVILLQGCASSNWRAAHWFSNKSDKIQFDLNQLNSDGLQGPSDGLRTLSYEFCIPDDINAVDQVMAIDPTLVVYKHSRGRVQCSEKEYLAIGHTGQRNYQDILNKLANLNYVKSIQEALFE
ncbi:hypothetical protein EOPP23_08470 [Endozoicomonas sp. OPT23]|uniref:hypothetical protein n=1 Tax=Endozoicomonas sp. OPT23 TaxID=2072845 RepID=UPI00129C02A7|nr:hypothetical protein [Endozoicomonas sp. OPT23]MRI33015.1 hypothetical protein [Endozoicomonas sp. OPT23]